MEFNQLTFPIGIFDSGVGGLSVLRAIWSELPDESVLYIADQDHVPYGARPLEEVRDFSEAITLFLLERGTKAIVVACNAASAAALHHLRKRFPGIPFIGMEPAVKPAVETTRSGVVGVLATPATFQGALYASVVERFANGVILLQHTCPGLVQLIEAGSLDTPETRFILEEALLPMVEAGIDTVVLGCTHYPFVIPLIQEIVGEGIRVIDPAYAVARQVNRILEANRLSVSMQSNGEKTTATAPLTRFFTSGKISQFEKMLKKLINIETPVQGVYWKGKSLVLDYPSSIGNQSGL